MSPWRERLRDSRVLLALELLAVAVIFVGDWRHMIFFSKTPYLLALGWASMAARGVRWRDLGFSLPARWGRLVLIGLAAGAAMEALELFATQPGLVALTGRQPDLSDVQMIAGNWKFFLVAVGLSWILAALGEELVWRGYLLNRLAGALGGSWRAWAAGLVVMSAAFGLAHADQGITGVIENTLNGLLLGGLYLAAGRNLVVPIIAHGVTDTIDVTLIYSGHYPGL